MTKKKKFQPQFWAGKGGAPALKISHNTHHQGAYRFQQKLEKKLHQGANENQEPLTARRTQSDHIAFLPNAINAPISLRPCHLIFEVNKSVASSCSCFAKTENRTKQFFMILAAVPSAEILAKFGMESQNQVTTKQLAMKTF